MSRKSSKKTPVLLNGTIYSNDASNGTRIDGLDWSIFVAEKRSFYFDAGGRAGYSNFTARCEARRKGCMWYAFAQVDKKLFKAYLGRSEALTHEKLLSVSQNLYKKIYEPKEGLSDD